MKRFFTVCVSFVIAAGIFAGCCKEDKVDLPKGVSAKEVRMVSRTWLEKLDKGWYSQAYDETAKVLKNNLNETQWLTNMTTYRKPLGIAQKRKEINMFYMTELPGSPKGDYIVVQYGSVFLKNQTLLESLILVKEENGSWRVSAYQIK